MFVLIPCTGWQRHGCFGEVPGRLGAVLLWPESVTTAKADEDVAIDDCGDDID